MKTAGPGSLGIDGRLFSREIISVMVRLALAIACILACTSRASAQATIVGKTISEHGDGYEISFAYPQIGIPSADAAMQDWVQDRVNGFKDSLTQRASHEPPYFAQLTYTVARNDDSALSILFSYSVYTGGAHPNLVQTAFNFLMPDGARVFLPDLIGDDGIKRVSDLAIADLTARLAGPNGMSDPAWIRAGAGPYADNFDTFELLPDQIVLEFDPYDVAAYAAGPQEVRIPLSELQDALRPDPRAPLPSFDCAEARTVIEQAICSDMTLAQLDRRTGEAFNTRLRIEALGNQPPTVRAQQQAWLAQRDAACAGSTDADLVACLEQQYALRLTALQNFE
jgi:peptidoglycan-N-acetylglucosamine deacetylase